MLTTTRAIICVLLMAGCGSAHVSKPQPTPHTRMCKHHYGEVTYDKNGNEVTTPKVEWLPCASMGK